MKTMLKLCENLINTHKMINPVFNTFRKNVNDQYIDQNNYQNNYQNK